MLHKPKKAGDVLLYKGRLHCVTCLQYGYYCLLDSDGETPLVAITDSRLQDICPDTLGVDKDVTAELHFLMEMMDGFVDCVEKLWTLENCLQQYKATRHQQHESPPPVDTPS